MEPSRGGEAGGLQGTSLNLGASLGVALVGSVLLAGLVANFTATVNADPNLPESVKQEVTVAAEANANFVSASQLQTTAEQAGLPPDQVDALVTAYSDAQLKALRASFACSQEQMNILSPR